MRCVCIEAFVLAIGVPIWKQRGREGGRCSLGASANHASKLSWKQRGREGGRCSSKARKNACAKKYVRTSWEVET